MAWVDVGLFRKLDGTDFEPFQLVPPPNFDDTRVGFSLVWPQRRKVSVDTIMKLNLVWVAGGVVLAKREVGVCFLSLQN